MIRATFVFIGTVLATLLFGSWVVLSALLRVKDGVGSPYDIAPRGWARFILWMSGVRLVEHGAEHKTGAQHIFVVNHVATYLRQLERSLGSRQAWVNELQGAGSTSSTFHTEVEGAWENYGREMAYQRTVAERAGEPAGFLANCDLVLAALKLAEFEPEPASTTYDGHTFTSTYTLEAVQAGAANVEALGAAIAAAQAAFTDAR